jgi:hypothetical protein
MSQSPPCIARFEVPHASHYESREGTTYSQPAEVAHFSRDGSGLRFDRSLLVRSIVWLERCGKHNLTTFVTRVMV